MRTSVALGFSLALVASAAASAVAAEKLSVATLASRLAAEPKGAEAVALAGEVRAWFGKDRTGKDNVALGANPKVEGLDTAWAIDAPDAQTIAVVTSDGKSTRLARIGDTSMFAATFALAPGSGLRWKYVKNQGGQGRQGQVEAYVMPPEFTENPAVPKGKLTKQAPWESEIFPNTKRDWWVYVPAQYKDDKADRFR
jgi:hypothetical protein